MCFECSPLPWMAVTAIWPKVNLKMVGPIGYFAPMMWHCGHSFSLGTGYNLHFLNFPLATTYKTKMASIKWLWKKHDEHEMSYEVKYYWCVEVIWRWTEFKAMKRQFCLKFSIQEPRQDHSFPLTFPWIPTAGQSFHFQTTSLTSLCPITQIHK